METLPISHFWLPFAEIAKVQNLFYITVSIITETVKARNMTFSLFSVERISYKLRKAVDNGDLQKLISIINLHKVNVNSYSFCGMSAVQLACRDGQKEIVQWLLDQPETDLEKMGPAGHHAIYHAVYEYS